jgi:hypothetical protein
LLLVSVKDLEFEIVPSLPVLQQQQVCNFFVLSSEDSPVQIRKYIVVSIVHSLSAVSTKSQNYFQLRISKNWKKTRKLEILSNYLLSPTKALILRIAIFQM